MSDPGFAKVERVRLQIEIWAEDAEQAAVRYEDTLGDRDPLTIYCTAQAEAYRRVLRELS